MTASPDFSSSTLTDLQKLTDERDRARDIAVRLEQENARLLAAIRTARAKIAARQPSAATRRADRRWWKGFNHGLDCALSDLAAAAPVDGER